MKKFLMIGLMIMLGASTLLGADLNTLNTAGDDLIKGAVGTSQVAGGGFLYTAAGWGPILLVLIGAIGNFVIGISNKQPNEKINKFIWDFVLGGFYGFIATLVFWAIIGKVAAGDVTKGPNITVHYWNKAAKSVAGDDVFTEIK